jgi:hypothetical protein
MPCVDPRQRVGTLKSQIFRSDIYEIMLQLSYSSLPGGNQTLMR